MHANLFLSMLSITAALKVNNFLSLQPYGSVDDSKEDKPRLNQTELYPSNVHTHNECMYVPKRKEFRELTDPEKELYLEANDCLLHTPAKRPGGNGSLYDDFVFHHMDIATSIHFTPLFLPFHRVFIIAFERALQKCDPKFKNVQLTYWDVALDSLNPERSILWQDRYFGGNGNIKNKNCLESGHFKGRISTYPVHSCLKRDLELEHMYTKGNAEQLIGAMYTSEQLQMIKTTGGIREYDYFRNLLESTIHEALHFGIGGGKGDMGKAETAPNDPIFWMHHTNIDRVWHDWQISFPDLGSKYDGKNEKNTIVSLEDTLDLGYVKKYLPFGWDKDVIRVKDVMDIKEWCYSNSPSLEWGVNGELVENLGGETRIARGFRVASDGAHH